METNNMPLHKEIITAVIGVVTPSAADATVTIAANLDHVSSIIVHCITAICTICVTVYTIRKKKKK